MNEKPSRLQFVTLKRLFILLGIVGGLCVLGVAYIWLFGVSSGTEKKLATALERVRQGGAKGPIVWNEISTETWRTVCSLPEYTTREKVLNLIPISSRSQANWVWLVYWDQDDRFFGYLLVDKNGEVLPLKIWKTTGWYSRQDKVICIPYDQAILRIENNQLSLDAK